MTPPIYKRGKLDPSEYGKVVSMAEHAQLSRIGGLQWGSLASSLS
jgi:hypothetical protein